MEEISKYLLYFLIAFKWTLFFYIILSWFPNFRNSAIYRLLNYICGSFLDKFRRIIPPIFGIDFSPLIAFILIEIGITFLQK